MKKKEKLILAAVAVFLVLVAIFAPGILWKIHLNQLSGKSEIRNYDISRVSAVPTPLDVSDIFYDPEATLYSASGLSVTNPEEQLAQDRDILIAFLAFCEEDTRAFLTDLLQESNLINHYESAVYRQTENGMLGMTIVNCSMEYYGEEANYWLSLIYEKKTSVICEFDFNQFYNSEDDERQEKLDPYQILAAVDAYYESLGIGLDRYRIEEGNPLTFRLCEKDWYQQMGSREKTAD
ncbi:MAG: hypothetical protein IKI32_08630 [Lachnospiraceae bacterium]|nr:hypothetical protein [Lachnospiraceae bacterium]MBR3360692.1 hypothetical protein [Lachnospiraceae bacterium]MBR7076974.1 hypothetical protein [Lachnospiraceae bacterium]